MNLKNRFLNLWHRTVNAGSGKSVWDRLDGHYCEPVRAYHNWTHIEAMLGNLDRVRREPEFVSLDVDAIELAIFFHDAIYDPQAKDNEAKSADRFVESVVHKPLLGSERVQRIVDMILATTDHRERTDAATRLMLDIDLCVLGAEPQAYGAYVEAVRREYAFVPDELWRTGRPAVLARFLERPAIYQTGYFHSRYERAARANVTREIASLGAG